MIGAGLFTRSLRNLAAIDPGFRTHDLLTFAVNPGLNGYTGARRPVFYKAVRDRLAATPGVTSVAFSSVPALGGQMWASTITIAGYQPRPGEEVTPLCNAVSPGYFRTLGIPFVAGHDFTTAHERLDEPGPGEPAYHAAIVSETFVTRYLGGSRAHAIGRRIGFTSVIGLRTFAMQLQRSLAADRLIAALSLTFSVLATLLAMVGLYGVTAYSVTQRTREIGIRMALGATAHGVAATIARDVGILVAIGVAIALPATYAASGYVQAQLYGVSPTDPGVVIMTVIVLGASAAFAGTIPARRAARIDPVRALRQD